MLSVDLMSLCVFVRLCDFCSSVQFCERKNSLCYFPPFLCYPVSTAPYHAPALCYSSNLFLCYPVLTIPYHVPPLCYSSNLFLCYFVFYFKQLVHPSTRPPVNLPRYLVLNIPCLLHISYYPLTIIPLLYPLVSLGVSCPPQIEMLKPQYSNL